MKLAAPPCDFSFYNKDNKSGSDDTKYFVSDFSFSNSGGATSGVVSGNLYIDQISVDAQLEVTSPVAVYSGSASFVFPAAHWAFVLDGHATLAEGDVVTKSVALNGVIDTIPVVGSFDITAEIISSGQSVYDDWSQV
jgi:hypothetical protein